MQTTAIFKIILIGQIAEKISTYAFTDTFTSKAALQINVNMLKHQNQMCFCPVCGGSVPLRGTSAAAAQFLITLQQTRWSALLRDQEHTRHPSAKPAALKWRYFTKLSRLYFTATVCWSHKHLELQTTFFYALALEYELKYLNVKLPWTFHHKNN